MKKSQRSGKPRRKRAVAKRIIAKLFSTIPSDLMHFEPQGTGFFFGTTSVLGIQYYVSKPMHLDGNIMGIGGTGSGKSSCGVMPNLLSFPGSIIATDIKGELSAHYDHLLNTGQVKRPSIRFAPMEECRWSYDPFAILRQHGEEYLTQYAREIALSIIPLPPDVRDPFWIEGAQNLLTAAILYYFGIGASFSDTIIGIQTMPVRELVGEIVESRDQNALLFINQIRDLKLEVLAGIATEMSNNIMVFATDPFISAAFQDDRNNKNCFSWDHIDTHNIFLCIPSDKIDQWLGAITLMINQLFRTLERRPDQHTPQAAGVTPILLQFDELPRFGKLDIVNAISTLRSKQVTFALFIQSLAQLDLIYGVCARRVIADNCSYKVFYGANDPDSQQYMSELIGDHEVTKVSYTISNTPQADSSSKCRTEKTVHESTQYEPFIRPAEFGKLKDIILITPDGHHRVDKAPYYQRDKPKKKNPIVRAISYISRKVTDFFQGFTTRVFGFELRLNSWYSAIHGFRMAGRHYHQKH